MVITGAARGLGRAYADLLVARGAQVVVNDVEPDSRAAIDDTHDVSTPEGASALVDAALARFGRIDALIANAGIMQWADIPDADAANLDAHMAVHLGGSFHTARAAWPNFVEQGYGRIVLTTSTGLFGLRGNVSYASAKGAVIGLMRALAFAGRAHGIAANCIAPAASTRLAGDGGPGLPPALVAPMAAYLAHEACPVTGEIYTAGGGRFARVFVASTNGYVDDAPTIETVADNWAAINDEAGYFEPADLTTWAAHFLGHL